MGDIRALDHLSYATCEILAVEQLALLIHKSPSSIRSDASRNPDALPPICRLPGNKRLLWRREDVMAWLAMHVQQCRGMEMPDRPAATATEPRKRGRPRKTVAMEIGAL